MTAGHAGDDAAVRAAVLAGKSVRAIAVDLYGAIRVAAERDYDGWMRAKVRRLVHRARAASVGRPHPAGRAGAGSRDDEAGPPGLAADGRGLLLALSSRRGAGTGRSWEP